jgi:predicted GIY-YIG superfamily endonuclease
VAEIRYFIYCIYTNDNEIYIGLSKNPWLRIQQHKKKSCNFRLRKLFDEARKKVYSSILHSNLTEEEASQLEKKLIKQYRNDPNYTILNIQSGGIRGGAKITKQPKIERPLSQNSKHLSDEDVVKMRYRYSTFKTPIDFRKECKSYGISHSYFRKLLKGQARHRLAGPRLGKEYIING